MKTVLLLGGPAAGQRVEVHGNMGSVYSGDLDGRMSNTLYKLVPMCSHGEVHWFGVLDGADPLALLIAGYAPALAARYVEKMDRLAASFKTGAAALLALRGTSHEDAAQDFSPTKNREGEAP